MVQTNVRKPKPPIAAQVLFALSVALFLLVGFISLAAIYDYTQTRNEYANFGFGSSFSQTIVTASLYQIVLVSLAVFIAFKVRSLKRWALISATTLYVYAMTYVVYTAILYVQLGSPFYRSLGVPSLIALLIYFVVGFCIGALWRKNISDYQ